MADVATGEKHDITKGVPTVFADTSDDHNNLVPPPTRPLGWTKDGSAVLLSDGFDVWKVPVRGGAAVNLTVDGKKNQIRYQRLYAFERQRAGAPARWARRPRRRSAVTTASTSRKPLYFATYGEWTKKEGLSKVDPSKPGAQRLVFDDAKLDVPEGEGRRRLRLHEADGDRISRTTTWRRRDFQAGAPAHRREPAAEGVRLDERREADQLHERQGRQAAGRALPAGQLRAGQEVPDARHDLREALQPREHAT